MFPRHLQQESVPVAVEAGDRRKRGMGIVGRREMGKSVTREMGVWPLKQARVHGGPSC